MNPRFRLDRFLTLYFFYPLMKLTPRRMELRIPILMYHSISDSRRQGIHPYYETSTSPKVFVEHMRFLHENGYRVVNLQDVKEYFTDKVNKDRKVVVITFDDGFRDFYTEAFPVLQNYSFSATVFLPTRFIGNKTLKFKERQCLSWDEVRKLYEKGVIFGSHTVNHYMLKNLKMDEIKFELKRSKEDIESELGKSIESFSYPYKFPEEDKKFVSSIRELLTKCGYKNGVSTKIGTSGIKEDLFFLKRVPANSFDDQFFLKAKLERAYDWLGYPQSLIKKLKHKHAN